MTLQTTMKGSAAAFELTPDTTHVERDDQPLSPERTGKFTATVKIVRASYQSILA